MAKTSSILPGPAAQPSVVHQDECWPGTRAVGSDERLSGCPTGIGTDTLIRDRLGRLGARWRQRRQMQTKGGPDPA
jgi:hypothetical protein